MTNNKQRIHIVDDDEGVRHGLSLLLETVGLPCQLYACASDFLAQYHLYLRGCLIVDIRMPEISGLELQEKLIEMNSTLPIIFISGHGDIPMAVEAMRRGALDFIRKPFREQDILDRINEALAQDARTYQYYLAHQALLDKIASLSHREKQIFRKVCTGEMNKVIAIDLEISERTVEVHRSRVMKKLEVNTLAQLVNLKLQSELKQP
jgi:FixJ family two-component response regulator